MMRQRGRRRRKKNYTVQILWIVVAIVATVGLLVGYKMSSSSKSKDDDSIVNAAEHPTDVVGELVTVTPIVEATLTPTPTLEPTQVVESTITIEPTPQGPYKIEEPADTNEEDKNQDNKIDDSSNTVTPTEEPTQEVQKMVALTFDDGPYPPVTERLLKLLKDNDSHATFFVVGNRMDTYPDTVKQAFEDGNQIGNHTYDHKDLTKLTVKDIKYEVEYSNELINKNAAVGDAYVRPPYGAKSDTVRSNVNVPLIFWSVDSLDWKTRDKDAVYKEIMSTVQDGDIILMHDLYPSTADAMEKVIPELISQGYKLVTVQELLEAKGITPEAGGVYYNGR